MNAIQIKTVKESVKSGFTYCGDAIFSSHRSGKIAINALVKDGYLDFEDNQYGGQYVPTEKAKVYVKYGPYAVA